MKVEKYLESIGLENAIGEEFMNDEAKSYYTVEGLMEAYHQAKLDLLIVQNVSNQRKLLIGYNEYLEYMYNAKCLEDDDVDLYLKTK